jgi:hypothetical protein
MKTITWKIDKDGNAEVKEACGFGTGCQAATAGAEKRLGKVNESSRQTTEDYYIPETDTNITLGNE